MSSKKNKTGYTDLPIEEIEKDLLDIKVYVDSMSDFILNCETPMTIALQGDWGAGKTSMMNMICKQVEGETIPIWFNSWQFSQFQMQDLLVLSLFQMFLDKLEDHEVFKSFFKSIGKSLFNLGSSTLHFGVEKLTSKKLADVVLDNLNFSDAGSQIVSLKEKINKAVLSILKKKKKDRIVVFIDDLDRLSSTKAVELLEAMKIFLDVHNCVFILAVDYNVVVEGVKNKFGGKMNESKGKNFFDKMIQLPFSLPLEQYNLNLYVKNLFKSSDIYYTDDFARLLENSVGLYGFNPRDLKRSLNYFILLNKVMEKKGIYLDNKTTKEQKQKVAFAVLCMQMVFNEVYKYIFKNLNDIDENFFKNMEDINFLLNDDKMKQILAQSDDMNYELFCKDLKNFMFYFIDALQLDDDRRLSKEELDHFKAIVSLSTITSTSKIRKNYYLEYKKRLFAYWSDFINICKKRKFKLFANLKPVSKDYLTTTGKNYFSPYILENSWGVSFYLYDADNKNINIENFNFLKSNKEKIEDVFGAKLIWENKEDEDFCKIYFDVKEQSIIYEEAKWKANQEAIISYIEKLKKSMKPFVNKLL